jgi:hypothetical protein
MAAHRTNFDISKKLRPFARIGVHYYPEIVLGGGDPTYRFSWDK